MSRGVRAGGSAVQAPGGSKNREKKEIGCTASVFDGWIGGWGIKTNPAVPHAASAVLMGCFSDAAFLTATVLKNVFPVLLSSSFQSNGKFRYNINIFL